MQNFYDKIKKDRSRIILPLNYRCFSCEWYRDIGVGFCVANSYFCDCVNCPYYSRKEIDHEGSVPRL